MPSRALPEVTQLTPFPFEFILTPFPSCSYANFSGVSRNGQGPPSLIRIPEIMNMLTNAFVQVCTARRIVFLRARVYMCRTRAPLTPSSSSSSFSKSSAAPPTSTW